MQASGRLRLDLIALAGAAALVASGCARREPPLPVPPAFRGPLVGGRLPDLPVHDWAVRPPAPPELSARAARLILFWNHRDPTSLDALAFVDSLARAYPTKRLAVTTIHSEGDTEGIQRPNDLQIGRASCRERVYVLV